MEVTSLLNVTYKKLRTTCDVLAMSVAATMAASALWMYENDQLVTSVTGWTAPKSRAHRIVLALAGRERMARPSRPRTMRVVARKRRMKSVSGTCLQVGN